MEGVYVPHITPFKRDGGIDEEALRTCIRFWLKNGLHGLVTCGSNGEAPYLSREERKKVIKTAVDEVDGTVPVVAGTGSMSTRETISLTRDAKDLGVDAALVVTPFYFKLSNREMYEHYKSVMEAVELPIILYSVPKFTGFHLDVTVVSKLALAYENVVGVKDSGGSMSRITELTRLLGKEISVLAGTGDLALPTLVIGGAGAVVAVANVAPKMCAGLYKSFNEGDLQKAGKLQQQITHINDVLMRCRQISSIKATLNLLGLPGGYPRRPVLPSTEQEKNELKSLVKLILRLSSEL